MPSPSPLALTNSIGPVTLSVTIPPTSNYGASAQFTASLQNSTIANTNFTPANNQYSNDGTVGTTKYTISLTYIPPTTNTNGYINAQLTIQVQGQKQQDYSGNVFGWTGDGTVLIPPSQ